MPRGKGTYGSKVVGPQAKKKVGGGGKMKGKKKKCQRRLVTKKLNQIKKYFPVLMPAEL